MDRRAATRVVMHRPVRVTNAAEAPVPRATSIDASTSGILVAIDEPFGLVIGARLCISTQLDDGQVHLMGRVRRVERGDDFRTYVAVSLDDGVDRHEHERWDAAISGWRQQLRAS